MVREYQHVQQTTVRLKTESGHAGNISGHCPQTSRTGARTCPCTPWHDLTFPHVCSSECGGRTSQPPATVLGPVTQGGILQTDITDPIPAKDARSSQGKGSHADTPRAALDNPNWCHVRLCSQLNPRLFQRNRFTKIIKILCHIFLEGNAKETAALLMTSSGPPVL